MAKRKISHRRHDRRHPATPRPEQAPDGLAWIYGTHAVEAALDNPQRRRNRLVATAEAASRLRENFPSLKPEILDRAKLDALLPEHAVHQGIALLAQPLQTTTIEDLLAGLGTQAIIVVLDRVSDPQNVGAVLRSAAAFKAIGIVVQDRGTPPSAGALTKTASGALDILPLIRVANLVRALDQLEDAGFWLIGFDGDAVLTLEDVPLNGRVALVLGGEDRGLRRLTREACDHLVRIAAPGKLKTLNVSNAAAIALYEVVRRHNLEK